jgi:hypothetical protein
LGNSGQTEEGEEKPGTAALKPIGFTLDSPSDGISMTMKSAGSRLLADFPVVTSSSL